MGIRGPAPGAAWPSRPARLGPPECTACAPRGPPSRAPWPRRERLPGSARRQRGRPRDAPGPTAPSKRPPPPAGSILVGLMRTQCPGTPASSVSRVSGSSWLCVLLGGPAMLADLHQASQRCASSLRPLSALLLGDSNAETIVRFLSLFSQRGNQRPAGSQTAAASPGMAGLTGEALGARPRAGQGQ